jgi:hypothetical protein
MCLPLRSGDAACWWRPWVEAGSVVVVTDEHLDGWARE